MAVFKNSDEAIAYFKAHLEVKHATKNGAYTSGRTIKPDGDVNHSTGCAQPSPDVFFNQMNNANAGWGVNYILGDFHKGEGRVLEVLKPTTRPWGCGSGSNGSWNNSRVQWEVCEPAGHTYSGGTMIAYDAAKNKTYFDRMWKLLVALNVYVVKTYGFDVSHIADHAESYKAGYGTNHSDMGQWLPKHGKSMSALRAEVKEILNANPVEEKADAKPATGGTVYYVQVGAYKVRANADAQLAKLRKDGFDGILKLNGELYKVQIGAYSIKANAEAMANMLKSKGYSTCITTTGGKVVTASTKTVEELAKEVIAGKWGVGDARRKALTNAGYDYDAIQKKVNQLLK